MELYELTAHELEEKLKNKEITSLDIINSCMKRIKEKENDIQAFVTITEKEAIEEANKENSFIPIGIKTYIMKPREILYKTILFFLTMIINLLFIRLAEHFNTSAGWILT